MERRIYDISGCSAPPLSDVLRVTARGELHVLVPGGIGAAQKEVDVLITGPALQGGVDKPEVKRKKFGVPGVKGELSESPVGHVFEEECFVGVLVIDHGVWAGWRPPEHCCGSPALGDAMRAHHVDKGAREHVDCVAGTHLCNGVHFPLTIWILSIHGLNFVNVVL